jgi:hypothetical protein
MVASPTGIWPEKEYAGEGQQHIKKTRPLVREGAPHKQDRNCQRVSNNYLVMSPRWGSTPRLTDWLTVVRNVTLTLWVTSTVGSQLIHLGSSSEIGDSQRGHEAVNTNVSRGSYGIGSRYQTTTGEDTAVWEVLVRAVVNFSVCKLVMAL